MRKIIVLLALLPLVVMSAQKEEKTGPELTAPTRFEYRMAQQALDQGDMQMAWDYLRQDHYLNPKSGWPIAEMANLMYYGGQRDEAGKLATDALKLLPKQCPKTSEMLCLKAYMCEADSQEAQAIKYFQQAIKASPDTLSPYLGLADAYNRQNQFKKEEQVIDQMKRVAPQNSLPYLYGCRNYEMQGKPILAIKDGKRALQLDSTDYQIHSFLATAYFDTDCPALGCQEVVAAVANPRLGRALRQYYTYGMVCEQEMERATRAAMAANPRLHDYYASLFAGVQLSAAQYWAQSDSARTDSAQILISQHRQKALDYYQEIQELTSADLYNLACLYALRGEQQTALEYLHRAVEAGYDDKDWAMRDEDLMSLHLLPEYLDLLQQMEINRQSKIINQ